jgi:hypothetical protein
MVRLGQRLFATLTALAIGIVLSAGGCGGKNGPNEFGGGGPTDDASVGSSGNSSGGGASGGGGNSSGFGNFGGSGGGAPPTCMSGQTGWKCAIAPGCDANSASPTTLSGKVFDPAKTNALYNVIVFIPNDVKTLPAITPGTHSCNTCDVSIGNYVTATATDAAGHFQLRGVPNGNNVPVTVQIGKWRRTTFINIPKSCGDNTVQDGVLHLPGKQSDGDMPQMAVLTGGCDDLSCFLTGIGIDKSEFAGPGMGKRLDVYQGTGLGGLPGPNLDTANGASGNCTAASCPLWASKQSFEKYDIVLFSCECGENSNTKPTAALQALHDWLNEGGKVFASHYHYYWFEDSPAADFKGVANWGNTGNNDIANPGSGTYDIDVSFPKGAQFAQWLNNVTGLVTLGPPPTITVKVVADSVKTVIPATIRWIYDPASPNDVKYMSFGTPIGGAPPPPDAGPEAGKIYCGKAVFTDLHTGGSLTAQATSVPSGCMNNVGMLSSQQKALEWLFFDLSACVQNDTQPIAPIPPPQ